MPRNTDVAVPASTWTPLTNADVTALRAQNRSGFGVLLQATNGAIPPSDLTGTIELRGGETLAADLTLAQLWPGVSGANRVYAWCALPVTVSVSHA